MERSGLSPRLASGFCWRGLRVSTCRTREVAPAKAIEVMGQISTPAAALLIVAVTSRHESAFSWSLSRAAAAWGSSALESPRFLFTETDYYHATMGSDLRKQFFALETLIDPARLPAIKRQTNTWEAAYAAEAGRAEPRPLNLDPGYLTLGKLVLASTKDHAHRIYLSDGIYAEITLYYKDKRWWHRDWTYPDYRREDYQHFFSGCRDFLKSKLAKGPPA